MKTRDYTKDDKLAVQDIKPSVVIHPRLKSWCPLDRCEEVYTAFVVCIEDIAQRSILLGRYLIFVRHEGDFVTGVLLQGSDLAFNNCKVSRILSDYLLDALFLYLSAFRQLLINDTDSRFGLRHGLATNQSKSAHQTQCSQYGSHV